MSQVWRIIRPERPVYHGNRNFTTKATSTLAIDALAINSADADWASQLTDDEVDIAMRHACYAGQSSDDWVDRLCRARPSIALKVVAAAVAFEFKSEGKCNDLLVQTAYNETAARPTVTQRVFELLKVSEPIDDATLERALRIMIRGREHLPGYPLRSLVLKRLNAHLASANQRRAVEYFGLYALLEPDNMAVRVSALLEYQPGEATPDWAGRAQRWLGDLFALEGSGGSARAALSEMSIPALVCLVKLAYACVPPDLFENLASDEAPTRRDAAESARRALMNTLIARPGAEAFHALCELAEDPCFTESSLRLSELAHRKAESDGDLVPWKASEIFAFERLFIVPVKTGAGLLRLVLAVLSDITDSFDQADASSRGLLALAEDEKVVQNWLTERLNERSKGRFHAHREPEVAQLNEPDIIVSSTSADVQVAIEVKNANKGWTVKQLGSALRGQLARDYLRTKNRRHGILVISLHKHRTWKSEGQVWTFPDLMKHLSAVAATVRENDTGPVDVRVVGLDATERTSHADLH